MSVRGGRRADAEGDGDTGEERSLQVTLELGYSESCCLSANADDVDDVMVHVVDGACLSDVTYEGEEDARRVVHTNQDLTADCICSCFHACGCIPDIERVTAEYMTVVTYATGRDVLRDLVDTLRTVTDTVRLVRIVDVEDGETGSASRNVLFDLTVLTEKQRTTLQTAVVSGYYDSPRGISMDELAAKLDISKATLSYHLSTAESKIVNGIVGERPSGEE